MTIQASVVIGYVGDDVQIRVLFFAVKPILINQPML